MTTPKAPYGDVAYADPGYQNDGKKRYPIDTADHVRAAWSYINQADNAGQYSAEQLASIKSRIRAAAKRLGVQIAEDDTSTRFDEYGAEIFTRNTAVVTDVKPVLRQVDMMAAPWEQFAQVVWRDELWNERYIRGCFNGYEDQCTRTRVNREHQIGATIGKVVRADTQHRDGMVLTVQLAKTLAGDEALQLAADDMISGSLGYRVKRPSDVRLDRRAMRRDVLHAIVDHFAFVEQPAYEGAGVLAVRDPHHPFIAAPSSTPELDRWMGDSLLTWAAKELGSM